MISIAPLLAFAVLLCNGSPSAFGRHLLQAASPSDSSQVCYQKSDQLCSLYAPGLPPKICQDPTYAQLGFDFVTWQTGCILALEGSSSYCALYTNTAIGLLTVNASNPFLGGTPVSPSRILRCNETNTAAVAAAKDAGKLDYATSLNVNAFSRLVASIAAGQTQVG